MNRVVAKEFCKGFMREIANELAKGNTVCLTGLGTIKTRKSNANGRIFNGNPCRNKFAYLFVPSKNLIAKGVEFRKVKNI